MKIDSQQIAENFSWFRVSSDPDNNLKSRYNKMTSDLRSNPLNAHNYVNIFVEIFGTEETKLALNGNDCYFANGDDELSDFGAIVLQVNIMRDLTQVFYELELLVISQYEKPKIISVNSLELGSSRWIESLGTQYLYEDGKLGKIKKIIKTMTKYAPFTETYLYSGWATDKQNTYIMEGEELCAKKYDEKLACEHVLKMLDVTERRLTIILLTIALLSLVQSQMILLGEFFKGVICFLGPTQSFKTTISALFLDFKGGRQPDTSFSSTEAAISRTIGSKRDAPVIIDDLKPPTTSTMLKSLMLKLEKIIRICSDDSGGYQRAGLNNSIIANQSSCIAVVTAEQLPNQAQSSLARLLVNEVNKKSVNLKALTYHQAKHDIYKAFIINYILHVSSQGVDKYSRNFMERFLRERDALRSNLLIRNIYVDNRTNDMTVWLYTAFDEFLKYSLKVDAINQEQLENYKNESLQIFLNLMQEQAERINELDDVNRFFKGLRYLLDTRNARIAPLQSRNSNYASEDSKSAIGFSKSGYVYLKNDVAFQAVVTYYRRFAKDFVLNEVSLRRMLINNGHLVPNSKNPKSHIHRLSVNRESYQCIKLEEATFYKLLKGG